MKNPPTKHHTWINNQDRVVNRSLHPIQEKSTSNYLAIATDPPAAAAVHAQLPDEFLYEHHGTGSNLLPLIQECI